ncbi:MAG: glycosyltransferase family 2 protein [Candidatus Omnitrophica bacterium]|nr:glycosyltransferase family 2 protein [Candidatus Omnitrophota bacterium]
MGQVLGKVPISVVILAKNEEERIEDCIKSVTGWAAEIIVVDDDSKDRTQKIAQNLGAKVLVRKMDIEGAHRNWAYFQAANEWVFSLDADERPTEELKKEIEDSLGVDPECSVFIIPRKNYIGDYWIRGGGLYPAGQMKLFKKGLFKWEEAEVHPRSVMLGGTRGYLKNDLIHYTYKDWGDFLNKLNRQTDLEAKKWYKLSLEEPKKAAYKMNFIHALWRALDRFIRGYFIKKGYRDGFIGFMMAYFSSLYQIVSFAKYREFVARGRIGEEEM